MIEIRHESQRELPPTQQAYEEIYLREGISMRDSFYLWLISLLNPEPGSLLLDISCGEGKLVGFSTLKGVKAIGVDFSANAVYKGYINSPQSNWIIGDGEALPLSTACADYVMHIGSLEHYLNPLQGMVEIARVLKPTGKACVLLPNSYGLFGNIKYVWKTGHVFDDGQPLQRYNTKIGWERMLNSHGLSIYKVIKYEREWPLVRKDILWFMIHPLKLLRAFFAWFIPLNLSNCFVYLCTPSTTPQ